MWTASDIRRLIFRKGFDELFTTRDFLRWGSRAAVDQALSRMVKKGIIKRIARGVFARDDYRGQNFKDESVAIVKASSFGRSISRCHEIVPRTTEGETLKTREGVFLIDGRSSKFKIGDRTIVFKQISKRQMAIEPSKTGQALSALWQLKKTGFTTELMYRATATFNRLDKVNVWTEMRWMPHWLTASLKGFSKPLKPRSQW